MTDTVYYNIGQIRYSSDKTYNNPMTMSVLPYDRKDNTSNLNYRDVILDFSGHNNNDNTYLLNSVYCINLQIPRNRSYDMIFDLLMVNRNQSGIVDLSNYQFIRRIRVPKQDNANTGTSTVVLYPYENDVRVGIVKATRSTIPTNQIEGVKEGDIVKVIINPQDETQNFNYYVRTNTGYDQILQYTDSILTHTWEQELTEQLASYDIVFTNKIPSATAFNCLYLKMERQGFEADIQYTVDGEEGTYYGLYLDESIIRQESSCVELINWISDDSEGIIPNINNSNTSLNTIGVWTHPDAIMAINGEEIRVGQSGYYELNDFNITNFSMLIRNENDKFSLDYQYKKN